MIGNNDDVANAILVVTKAIKEDPDYRRAWKDNIAMAFKDEYAKGSNLSEIEKETIHDVANRAANRFLDQLIG